MYYTTLEYFQKLYRTTGRAYAFHAETKEEYAVWAAELRGKLREIAGIDRGIPCEPVHEFLRTEEAAGFQAEYHTLETEPGVIMPFYLVRPDKAEKDCPVLIIPHGHGGAKDKVLEGQKEFIEEALEDGFLVVCPDERGSGDRREFTQQGEEPEKRRLNSHRELAQLSINFGRTFIGSAVWDLMRLADYLQALPETGDFLACAGMSGGGQQTLWFAALDTRVCAAITSGYFYGVEDSLICLPGNCACNFVPHFFETADMGDLGALIAPRPFFVESGEQDHLSGKRGVENVKSQVEIARQAYALFDAEEEVKLSVHPGGHQWIGTGMRAFLQHAREL